ncbi:lipopolysaccharide biosynthesis protein [Sporosarcina sp. E16_8]|uniref:lipopolysaccharide biosynthesis protein n=1 Tax=Sporosarcina sp. E16_8 TaxID=2789295 RepID=UPI001A92092F|nr:lipopolysaccharide biosynthesis protein [Sporosarcina sp. E16_8]MBO0588604.1 lipopolysaccharide biosynthesis protein [Sporosarcina sp. E16_8]
MQDSNPLKTKTMTGLFWSFADLLANHGVQFVIQILLARLLLPEHFGVIGMILIFIAISNSIVDSGFSQALIRDQQTSQTDYSTVFYFNIMMAAVMYGILYFSAFPISNFFNEPQLIPILRVLSLVLIINSLGIIHKVMLIKNVDFKTIAKINVIAVLLSGSITISLAMMGYGVWSLVINTLSMQLIQTLLLWIFNKWVPSMAFNMQSFRKFYKFGYKLLLSGLLDTLYNNIYFVIIGRFYSTTQLGFYTNAARISNMASQAISATVQRVSYPILSSIQQDEIRLKSGFRKIIKTSAFINFPLMIGLAAIAPSLFTVLLGEKWMPSVVYFQLLCIAGMLYPLHAINLNILQVKGRSDLFLLIEIIKKLVLTLLISVSLVLGQGIIGLIVAAVLSSYIALYINTYFSAREIDYSAKDQLKDLFPVLLLSIVMGVSVATIGSVLPVNHIMNLTIQIGIGIVVYIAGCKMARVQELETVYRILLVLVMKSRLMKHKNKKIVENKIVLENETIGGNK